MNFRIKELCKEKNINVGDLAEQIGIARESLSRIINGSNTSTETLGKIASALEVPVTDLFEQPAKDVISCPHCGGRIRIEKD